MLNVDLANYDITQKWVYIGMQSIQISRLLNGPIQLGMVSKAIEATCIHATYAIVYSCQPRELPTTTRGQSAN